MNNKGFTLIELLAVIVILLGISLISVVGISSSLEKREVKDCEEQKEFAINAAKIYFSLSDNTTVNRVTIETLRNEHYFDNKKIDKLSDSDYVDKSNYSFYGTNCEG